MKSEYNFRSLLEINPDSTEVFSEISKLTSSLWIYDLSNEYSLNLLGLDSEVIYSDLNPKYKISNRKSKGSKNRFFVLQDDLDLTRFLMHSEVKQDVIKPYNDSNLLDIQEDELYMIPNAKIICSPLSICVLDSKDRIVKQASHNASEALYVWYLANKHKITFNNLEQSLFASVQQTFNLGHWFIDSAARLLAARNHNWFDPSTTNLLIDTVEHPLIKSTLESLGIQKCLPTLPFSFFEIEELLIPISSSFERRVLLGSELMRNVAVQIKPLSYSSTNEQSKKIFLSRQKQSRRKIINWNDIEQLLLKHGYKIIYPEEFKLFEMIDLLENTESILGPNGAALCNMLLAGSSPQSIGVVYPQTHLDDYYYRVSIALNKSFYAITNEISDNNFNLNDLISRYYYPSVGSDYFIEPSRFEKLLQAMESG